jgi:cell division cycle protein 20 (cofactor of APC complex)
LNIGETNKQRERERVRENIMTVSGTSDERGSSAYVSTPSKAGGKSDMDRFIPNRSAVDLDLAHFSLIKENDVNKANQPQETALVSPSKEEYKRRLAEGLLENGSKNSRILAFKTKAPAPPEGYDNVMRSLYTANAGPRIPRKQYRAIPQAPERILDAPELLDDYYLNLIDWNCNNVLAVALSNSVYLWNASTGDIQQLMQTGDDANDYVASVQWSADGKHIAVGTASANVQIWDASRMKQLRNLRGHSARVGALAWNSHILTSGGRDNVIMNHDVRVRDHVTSRLRGHEQEICGLKWSPSGNQLASGGNDNMLHVWDIHNTSGYLHRMDAHQAAVKALAWCPFHSSLLASGGGTADRCIKFWNTHTGACLNSIDTGSQVCSLVWNRHEREILSSHGFSQNQLCLWKYPSMTKIAELTGHTSRVLHLATSPDGCTVVSAAADETLRFWKVFEDTNPAAAAKAKGVQSGILNSINIR